LAGDAVLYDEIEWLFMELRHEEGEFFVADMNVDAADAYVGETFSLCIVDDVLVCTNGTPRSSMNFVDKFELPSCIMRISDSLVEVGDRTGGGAICMLYQ
jgi:hypothetical protein